MNRKIVILMGSEKDLEFCQAIAKHAKSFALECDFRVASAHKTPERVLQILKEYKDQKVIFITVAGKSNALSAFVDANTVHPVIACPPYSDKYAGADIYSTLRVPSGVGSVATIEPEAAAIAAAKILAMQDEDLATRIRKYQASKKAEIEKADASVKKGT